MAILSILIFALIGYNLYSGIKSDPKLIRKTYLSRKLDYLISFALAVSMFASIIFLISIDLPGFLTFSWWNLFGNSEFHGNVIAAPLDLSITNSVIAISFWLLLSLALPYLAESEEVQYRANYLSLKDRIIQSIKFGAMHIIVGIPVYVCLLLSIFGFVLSSYYRASYLNASKNGLDTDSANLISLDKVVSIHTKYNFILLTITVILVLLVLNYSR